MAADDRSPRWLNASLLTAAAAVLLGACSATTESPEGPVTSPTSGTTEEPVSSPTAGTTEEPDTSPGATQDAQESIAPNPPRTGPAPQTMPDAVGAWRSEAPLPTTALYSDGSGDAVSVTFNEAFTAEDDRERLDDPQLIEGWLCGYLLSQDDTVYCTTNAYEGNLSLLATQLDAEEMVAFGHEFLAAWR